MVTIGAETECQTLFSYQIRFQFQPVRFTYLMRRALRDLFAGIYR